MRTFGIAGLFLVVLFSGFVSQTSWLFGKDNDKQESAKPRHQANAKDLNSRAGWRYRTCQPRHWRSLVLKH